MGAGGRGRGLAGMGTGGRRLFHTDGRDDPLDFHGPAGYDKPFAPWPRKRNGRETRAHRWKRALPDPAGTQDGWTSDGSGWEKNLSALSFVIGIWPEFAGWNKIFGTLPPASKNPSQAHSAPIPPRLSPVFAKFPLPPTLEGATPIQGAFRCDDGSGHASFRRKVPPTWGRRVRRLVFYSIGPFRTWRRCANS